MVLNELIQRSPIRVFEKSIHGGLKAGEIGIIAAPSGIGKTSLLVQLALDKLLQGKKVIHISYTRHNDYILAWYENIFDEFVQKKNLDNLADVKDEAVKNRVLLKFSQEGVTAEQILRSIRALVLDGGFNAEAVIVDGFDFAAGEGERLAKVKEQAKELGFSVWYSCNVSGDAAAYDRRGVPEALKNVIDRVDVVIVLEPGSGHIGLKVSKDRDQYNPERMALKLDPRTLLILEG